MPWGSSDAPLVRPDRASSLLRQAVSATQKTHQAVSFGSSILAHVVVIAAISMAPVGHAVRWVPVQTGQASVELQASLASTAEEHPDGEPAALIENPAFLKELAPAAEPHLAATAAASIEQPLVEAPVPEVEVVVARLPAIEIAARVMPAKFDSLRHEEDAAREAAQPAETTPRLPRTNVGRHHAAALLAETIPAPESAGSQASEGAEASTPSPVYNPAPAYPPDALAARLTGRVVLRVEVAADGRVIQASVHRSSGAASLDAAALAAVRGWRFSPAARSDAPSREVAVPVNFVLAAP
jgi:protein TonB